MKKRSGLLIFMSVVMIIFGIYGLSKTLPVLNTLGAWGWGLTAFSGVSSSDMNIIYAIIIFSVVFYFLMVIAGIAGFACSHKKPLENFAGLLFVLSIILLIISINIQTFGALDVVYIIIIIIYSEGAGFCVEE